MDTLPRSSARFSSAALCLKIGKYEALELPLFVLIQRFDTSIKMGNFLFFKKMCQILSELIHINETLVLPGYCIKKPRVL
ncbi:hypothetical protein THIOSC13_660001 [uncultured Thiomicrorhabdus sp.]